MHFKFGVDDYLFNKQNKQVSVVWDTDKTLNAHMLLLGKSGTGKTYTLKRLIDAGVKQGGVRFHVFDVHGDITDASYHSILFSEGTDYGLNPLKINPDRHYGGVRRRIQGFISTLNRTGKRKLGPKQEAVLRNLLTDLYAANGFYADSPESWSLKPQRAGDKFPSRYPNVEDAYRFAHAKLKQLFIGSDNKAIRHLEQLNRTMRKMNGMVKRYHNPIEDKDELEEEIDKLRDQAIGSFNQYIKNIERGTELETLIKYDSVDVLKSTVDRLSNMYATGLFKNKTPPFNTQKSVWRYDLKALNEEEQRLFVEFTLQSMMEKAMQNGLSDHVKQIIIIDEAHLFFKDDEDNVLNKISKEARKFGIGLVCASQSPTHFSDDFLANVATKAILGLDQMYWEGSARKMKIESKLFNYITPMETMAVQISNTGSFKNNFKQVRITD